MEKRRFGRTEQMSTVAIFGAAAFYDVTQASADNAMEQVIEAGVNHIDVAPSYGQAEERLGPWLKKERDRFFLGCKSMERKKEELAAEMHRSLERLGVERFDLYQLHAVTSMEELDKATMEGGALEAILAARQSGLLRFVGVTSHGSETPVILLEALKRHDFDSVLFPLNFILLSDPVYKHNTEELLNLCKVRDVGVMAIKAIARGPWGEQPKRYNTWYQPFDDSPRIQQCVDFALSQAVTGLCTAADVNLLPAFLRACENHTPMSENQQADLLEEGVRYASIFSSEGAS
jgi:aryl-alcohol dehydrogenase-like predicted oxidoreductase